jgi:hypothetical protein
MTTATATPGSVLIFGATAANLPSTPNDKHGSAPNSGAAVSAWADQSSNNPPLIAAFTNSADYAKTFANLNATDSYWILLYNWSWSGGVIPGGATISDLSLALPRTQGTVTGATHDLYDWIVQCVTYNGSDLTSGYLGSNKANVTTPWPQGTTGTPTSANFTTATYDFGTVGGISQATLTNSNFGIVIAVDGSQASANAKPFIQLPVLTATYTAGGGPTSSPAAAIPVPF